ncbi:MAG TPA: hypothetical protein VG942_13795 [Hyphomonadaceae bacterium]|nr:hypothetical protein [Hyphomonadaceae bacterium]
MKLRPTQIVGLIAIVVFGGILAFTLLKPHDPDLLPSGIRLSELPRIDATPPLDTTPPPEKPLEVGSQDARDDLYCSGIVFETQLAGMGGDIAENQKRIDAYGALAEGGRAKLIAEKAVTESNAVVVGNAWARKAKEDYEAKALRIPLAECLKRPAALKAPTTGASAPKDEVPDFTLSGSQAARDDLYCAGVLNADFSAVDQPPEQMEKELDLQTALDAAGIAKLHAEGIATDNSGAMYSMAQLAKAKSDYEAKTLRIPVKDCMARGAVLPPAKH